MNLRIAFLTGQSNPASIALSSLQTSFLRRIPFPEECKLYRNFPYRLPHVEDPEVYRPVGLLRASLNNAWQYFRSRKPDYALDYSAAFTDEFLHVDRVVLLVGSCGLELFINLQLPDWILQKVSIFAYGAVARSVPRCGDLFVIRGNHDRIAALWDIPVDCTIACGHMDYLENFQLMDLLTDFLQRIDFQGEESSGGR